MVIAMKILFVASEAVPFVTSGGLADVAGALSKAIRHRGHACRVVLPLYGSISGEARQQMRFVTSFNVSLSWRNQYCGIFEATVDGVKYYFIDNEYYYQREGLYGFYDDAERFAFFSKAVLEMLQRIEFDPDIIHCNDWQTAMIPVYLNVFYRHMEKLRNVKTVFSIHNIQYQGTYDLQIAYDVLGLPVPAAGMVEFNGDVNLMKGAIEQCDALTTVSPTYAREILDPWYAHGLDALLQEKQHKLTGILNGIDYQIYDPQNDPHLTQNYSAADISGKASNKKDLQMLAGLAPDKKTMVIGMVTRMVGHKGLDLVRYAFHRIMEQNVQFVMLGSGEWEYEQFFRKMAEDYPRRVSVTLGFDPQLARRIYSGADVFLMPSRSEPCGLAQMIALRYGTIPIVRSTGGLADTIRDMGGENGNGYTFLTFNGDDMLYAITRALEGFWDKDFWNGAVVRVMGSDFSWGNSAGQYITLYKGLLEQAPRELIEYPDEPKKKGRKKSAKPTKDEKVKKAPKAPKEPKTPKATKASKAAQETPEAPVSKEAAPQ